MRGLAFADAARARAISRAAFERGLLVETSGAAGEVLKLMPPLTIPPAALDAAMSMLDAAIEKTS
jgi:diaminobutyrate-2-oxoglutarate transaminase